MLSIALAALVVIMMISIGLEVAPADLRRSMAKWPWLLAALGLNLIVFPFATWLSTEQFGFSAGLAVGFLLCAAAPGGPVGPVLSRLAHSDLSFATGLMVTLGIIGLVTTPLTISVVIEVEDGSSVFWPMLRLLLLFQILPLVLAMALRAAAPALASRLAKPSRALSNIFLVAIVAVLVATRGDVLTSVSITTHMVLASGLLILLVPVLAVAKLGAIGRGALIVTSVRNMSVALLLANQFFEAPEVEAAILIWSFWMLLLPGVIGFAAGRMAPEDRRNPENIPSDGSVHSPDLKPTNRPVSDGNAA